MLLIDELTRRVGGEKIGIQVLNDSVTKAKQKKEGVELTFETDCVTMHEIYTGQWDNIVMLVRVKREDFIRAVEESNAEKANGS